MNDSNNSVTDNSRILPLDKIDNVFLRRRTDISLVVKNAIQMYNTCSVDQYVRWVSSLSPEQIGEISGHNVSLCCNLNAKNLSGDVVLMEALMMSVIHLTDSNKLKWMKDINPDIIRCKFTDYSLVLSTDQYTRTFYILSGNSIIHFDTWGNTQLEFSSDYDVHNCYGLTDRQIEMRDERRIHSGKMDMFYTIAHENAERNKVSERDMQRQIADLLRKLNGINQ